MIQANAASMAVMSTHMPPPVGGGMWCVTTSGGTTTFAVSMGGFVALLAAAVGAAEMVIDNGLTSLDRCVPGSDHVQFERRAGGGYRS